MREVDPGTLPVPELPDGRLPCLSMRNKRAARRDFSVSRMVVEQARLDVRNQSDVLALELIDQRFRIRKLVAVPSEYVAPWPDAAVTRSKVERADRDVMLYRFFYELGEPRVCIRRIREAHRRVGVPQAPARTEGHPAGQLGELSHHILDARADEQVIVKVAILDLAVAVEAVIVVMLAPEIERRRRERVVEEPIGDTALLPCDDVRPVFVKRIARLGVVA